MKKGKVIVLLLGSIALIGLIVLIYLGRKSSEDKVQLSTAHANKLIAEAYKQIGENAQKLVYNEAEALMVAYVPSTFDNHTENNSLKPQHYFTKLIVLKSEARKTRTLLKIDENAIIDAVGKTLLPQTSAQFGYLCTVSNANKTPTFNLQIVDAKGAPASDELTLEYNAQTQSYQIVGM